MTTKTQTKLEQEIEANRAELAEARETERNTKAEIDLIPQMYREAREEGQRASSEAHQRYLAEHRGVADSKRQRAAVRASHAEQMELAEAPIRQAEKAEQALYLEHRAATARVGELEAQSWELERIRANREIQDSGVAEREQKARQAVEDAQAELEVVEQEKRQLEARASTANRRQHEARYRARQLRGQTPYQGNSIVISQ